MPSLPLSSSVSLTAAAGFLAVSLVYAGGYFALTNPLPVSLAAVQAETAKEDPNRNRQYLSFPMDLTANAPRFAATLNMEIGLAVREEATKEIETMIRIDPGQFMPAMTEAMRLLLEDPNILDIKMFQDEFPGFARDALNKSLSNEELDDPVLEVLIVKVITAS